MKGKTVERGKEATNPEGAIAAENPRDKALISVLYESGCRIGEILSLKIRNKFDNNCSVLIVNGKTGQHRVRLIPKQFHTTSPPPQAVSRLFIVPYALSYALVDRGP
ncbi:MAG: site-specific integrase [Candidatus Bathyarchaeia archaeon]|jgi:site-specific recombinase XerD